MLRAVGFTSVLVEPIAERDRDAFASYLENTLLGGITGPSKRAARQAIERDPRSAHGATPPPRRAAIIRSARKLKNAPFVPLAALVARFRPNMARALYFEAS
jgi:hypothetical protein